MTTHVGGRPAGEDSPLPGWTTLGGYRLVQPLGEGGMGVVHLALDRSGRAVALKALRPHIGHDPVARARLEREVQTLGRIRHPGVAPVLDADLEADRPYLVTRYVPGPPLDDVVRDRGPFEPEELLRLGRGLALALRAIHEAGVVHRDVKPGNVLLLDGDPVLIDFGIAHVTDDVRLTSTGLVMGTPGYLSPEIVEGAEVTAATDWWGWAATVAFAAAGRPPFGPGPMEAVLQRVAGGQADLTDVDPRLAPLLAAALDPDPSRRPEVEEVLAGLERYAAGGMATQVIPTAARLPGVLHGDEGGGAGAARTRVLPLAPPGTYALGDDDDGDPEPLEPTLHTDPRIGRPNRSGVLTALLALVVAATALAPLAAVAALAVWSVLARTADRSVTSLVLRRHAAGLRRSDVPVAVLSSPWHLAVGVVATLVGLALPALVLVTTAFCTALGLSATVGPVAPGHAVPLAVGSLFAALVAWWGPFGSGLRRGTRSLVRGATTHPVARKAVVAGVLLSAALATAYVLLGRHGQPLWWPLATAPSVAGDAVTGLLGR